MFRGTVRPSVRLNAGCVLLGLLIAAGCVIITTPLAVDAGPDIATTTGTTVLLRADPSGGTGQYHYIWSQVDGLSDPTAPNPTYLASTVGEHFLTVTVIDSSGDAASDTVRITVTSSRQPLLANAGPNVSTPVGSGVTLKGSATGGSGSYSYAWSPAAGLSSTTVAEPTFTPSAAGTTTLTLTVTDSEGLTATDTVDVTAYVATRLTGLTWLPDATAGYQLTAAFSQPVTKVSAEAPGAYRVHGSTTAATSAVLGGDNQTVTIAFTTEALAGSSTFDIGTAAPILDVNGNSVIGVIARSADANPADTTVPTVLARQWGADFAGSYQVLVQFSEAMDRLTTQSVSAYRLNGLVAPQSAALSGDGRTVTLVFANVTLSSSATLDIGLAGTIRDVNGLALAELTGQSIAGNAADTIAPTVVQVTHAAGFSSAGYRIDIRFSESMSAADVENPAGYQVNGVAAASAVAGSDGRSVAVTFQTPIASSDQITIGVGGTVKDINGNALVQTSLPVGQNAGDVTGPTIVQRTWGVNGANYQVAVTFNESMDRATATTTGYYTVATASGSANPTVASLDNSGKVVTLTFAATGSGFRRTDPLAVSGSVLDINGRANTSTAAAAIAADTTDLTAPTISSRVWGANAATYEAILTFSEVLDRTSALVTTHYLLQGHNSTDPRNPTAVHLDTTGRIVTLTFASSTSGFDAGDALEVSSNVLDINGKTNASTAAVAMSANAGDTAPPGITGAVRVDATHLDVTFSEVMDKASVEAAAYAITGGTVSAPALLGDGRTVRLTTSVDPSGGLVTVGSSVQDINANSPLADLTIAVP